MNILFYISDMCLGFTKSHNGLVSASFRTLGFSYSFPRLLNYAVPRLFSLLRFLAATFTAGCRHCRLVGSSGVEPPTSCLSGMRSNLLSYEPLLLTQPRSTFDLRFKSYEPLRFFQPMVEMKGFEPLTPCLQGRCSPN